MTISKTKRAAAFLTAVVMMLALSAFFCFERAYAEYSGEWEYEEVNGNANVISYLGSASEITIPSKLSNGISVYSVSGIGDAAKKKVTSVTLSSGIKAIGNNAFNGCENLSKVNINNSTLTSVGSSAFADCTKLTSIVLPSSVTTFGESVFQGCTALSSVKMECNLSTIPAKTFYGCKSLSGVKTAYYISSIGSSAFEGCTSLSIVDLPSGLKEIGENAFAGCTSLIDPALPNTLTDIGSGAFKGCKSITSLFVPNSVRNIYSSAFANCTNLKSAYLSASVKRLDKNVFEGCKSLEKVVFGGNYYGFYGFLDKGSTINVYYPIENQAGWNDFEYAKKVAYNSFTASPAVPSVTLKVNGNTTIKVNVNTTVDDLKRAYIFTSENPAVATVSSTGYVLAKIPGSTKINITTVTGVTKSVLVKVVPSAPTGLKATTKSTASVTLKWKASNASGYEVYRSTSKTKNFKKVGTTPSAEFTDKGLKKGTTYYYKVKAYVNTTSGKVYSDASSAVSAVAVSSAPSTVKVTKSGTAATVQWSKSAGANGYEVYMSTSKTKNFSKIYTASKPNTTSYKKTGLKKGKTYYFKVRSYVTNSSGKKVYSGFSTVKSVKI